MVVAAVVGLVVTSLLADRVGSAVDSLTNPDPIAIVNVTRVTEPELVGDFVLPGDVDHDRLRAFFDRRDFGTDLRDGEYGQFLTEIGAIDVGAMVWRVTLVGQRDSEVVVTALRPVLVGSCVEPLKGTLIENPSAGTAELITFSTAIDQPDPRFVRLNVETGEESDYFASSVLKLPKGEQNVIAIRATAERMFCRFRVELTYQMGGEKGHVIVSAANGEPFQVTGPVGTEAHDWVYMSVLNGCHDSAGRLITPRVPGAGYGTCPGGG